MDYSYLNQRDPRIEVRTLGQPDLAVVMQGGLQYLAPVAASDVWRQLKLACTQQAANQPYLNSTVWDLVGQDGSNPCSPNAADALYAVMSASPPAIVLIRAMATGRAEAITTSDTGVAFGLAQSGGEYAVLPPRGTAAKTKKKQEPVPVLMGVGAGAALGAAALGPVGAIGGAIAGGVIAAWLT